MSQHAHVVRAGEALGGQDGGIGMWLGLDPERTGARELWMARFTADPGFDTGLHYHSCDTGALLIQGRAVFTLVEDGSPREVDLDPGDWLFVPAGVVHAERTSGTETAEFVLARDRRGGSEPTVYVD